MALYPNNNINLFFPAVPKPTKADAPFYRYTPTQYCPGGDELNARYQTIKHLPYSTTVDMTAIVHGTVVATIGPIFEDRVALLDVQIRYVAATASVTTPGAVFFRILRPGDTTPGNTLDEQIAELYPADFATAPTLWAKGGTPAYAKVVNNQAIRSVTTYSLAAFNDVSLNGPVNSRYGHLIFPELRAGDMIEIVGGVPGVGGTQSVSFNFRYRELLPDPVAPIAASTANVTFS